MTDSANKKCQYCGEMVLAEAKKCKHCGEILDAQMREIENLKKNQTPNVFMNSSTQAQGGLRPFNHLLHIVLTVLTGGFWLIVYILLYVFRNKSVYY